MNISRIREMVEFESALRNEELNAMSDYNKHNQLAEHTVAMKKFPSHKKNVKGTQCACP
jgi:hypothetical protein